MLKDLEIRGLERLETVQFGMYNFEQAKSVKMEALPELCSFHIANNTLTKTTELTLDALPRLERVDFVGSALSSLQTMSYRNISDPLYAQFCSPDAVECSPLFPSCFKPILSYSNKQCNTQ